MTLSLQLTSNTTRSHRPSLRRTTAEAIALISPAPKLAINNLIAAAPPGDGHTVLVLPALARGDRYTSHVRDFLRRIGYSAHGWGLGPNIGPTKRLLDGSTDRLIDLSNKHGPVSLVGFSLGGLFARWLALRMPDRVRQVITVCSPIHEPARNFWLPLGPLLGVWSGADLYKLSEDMARPLLMPCTVLYSREDGLVNWTACVDAACPEDCIEITGPHVMIVCNPQVMTILAERLARKSTRRPADAFDA
jgi:pimeloyl-ACP methyl ester carboxylesterase